MYSSGTKKERIDKEGKSDYRKHQKELIPDCSVEDGNDVEMKKTLIKDENVIKA